MGMGIEDYICPCCLIIDAYIIWIDPNVDNQENSKYKEELKKIKNLDIKCYKDIDKAINFIKENIFFTETFIIVSGCIYIKFIEKFKQALKDICTIPRIIIFTRDKNNFLKKNENFLNIINHKYYNLGGIHINFKDVKDFIIDNLEKTGDTQYENNRSEVCLRQNTINKDESKLIFEYIDSMDQLLLPLLYKTLINIDENDIEIFSDFLYDKYNKYRSILGLLNSIKLKNIPLELLSKYYARIYTNEESQFYSELNKSLRGNQTKDYLPYIKVLYEGVRLQSLDLESDTILYRGTILSKEEIETIKKYLNNKIKDLPGCIVFAKIFLSFSKNEVIAINCMNRNKNNSNFSKVLFITENNDNIDYSLSTHCDLEGISMYTNEEEVLFFPFSSFEIKDIEKVKGGEYYKIYLKYLGEYIKKFENELSKGKPSNKIPKSKFFNEIKASGLIKEEEINNKSTIELLDHYKKYKQNCYNNNDNNSSKEKYFKGNDKDNNILNKLYEGNLNLIKSIINFHKKNGNEYFDLDNPNQIKGLLYQLYPSNIFESNPKQNSTYYKDEKDPLYYISEPKITIKFINYNYNEYKVKIPKSISIIDLYSIAQNYVHRKNDILKILLIHNYKILDKKETSIDFISNNDIIIIIEPRNYLDDSYYNDIRERPPNVRLKVSIITQKENKASGSSNNFEIPFDITNAELYKMTSLSFGLNNNFNLIYRDSLIEKKKDQKFPELLRGENEVKIFVVMNDRKNNFGKIYGKIIIASLIKDNKYLENKIQIGTLNSNHHLIKSIENVYAGNKVQQLIINNKFIIENKDKEISLKEIGIRKSFDCYIEFE